MSKTQATEKNAELTVENVGGIDTTEIALSPGVTSLTGRNATSRTSLLLTLMATLGSEHVSLKSDAEIHAIHEAVDTVVRRLPDEVGKARFFDHMHHADAVESSIGIYRRDRNMLARYVEELLYENPSRHGGGCGGIAAASPA